ncbi:MATE family efflux transporter [Fusobacterium sp.]|jgi:putative MATE family efflux protein|uniref:MATE family efflux transporter n=1 Tax=Fusobacterium sp. TaxID=68766 RepID=UPI0015A6F129|nr:MATE family efflux transporter [Fusobacterium sp.]MBS5789757.1 MATE family efflux transporter [Fusobacterium sp.]
MSGNQQSEKLGKEPLRKLFFTMAIPSVLAQLINVLYNIVDRIYIGHIKDIGSLALTGVGVTFPIIMVVSAFSAFAGQGGAPLASILLGAKDQEKAEKVLGSSTALLLVFSISLTLILQILKTPLLYAFGASDNVIGFAQDYIGLYLWGTIFVMLSLGLNTFISGQGNAKTAMFSVLIGAVTNIILDPIFIFVMNMGVKGAALATVISQAFSAIWVVNFLISKKSSLKIKRENLKLDMKFVKKIGSLGCSPFIMQSTESLVLLTLNSGLQKYGGDLYVGSMSILISVLQLIFVPVSGIAQGVQPIISYNFGAGNRERVIKTFKALLIVCLVATMFMGGIAVLFPNFYVKMFTESEELMKLTSKMMPIFTLGMCIFGIQQSIQVTFLAMGQAKFSIFIALLRKVILLVPLAIILPRFLGVKGIYYAEPMADITSVVVASITFALNFKSILKQCGKRK